MFLLFMVILLISNQIDGSANQTDHNKGAATVQTNGQKPSNVQVNDSSQPGQQPQLPQPQPNQPYFVINLNQTNSNNNDQANSQTNSNSNSSAQSNNNVHTNQSSIVNQIRNTIMKFLNFAKKEAPRHQAVALGIFRQHTKLILLGALACSYGLLFMYINTLSSFLSDKEGWHNWKQGVPIEELATLNQNDLAQTLSVAIQQRYFNPQKPGNSMKAFTRFYKDIEKEMQKIDRYIQVGKFIHTCQLDYFFAVSKKRIKKATEKKRRLEFMQKTLITYMSTQNTMPAMAMVRFHTFEQVMKMVKNSFFKLDKKEITEQQS